MINKRKKKLALFTKRVYRKRVIDSGTKDRLEILKANYEREIQAKENELAALKAKLASLVEFSNESEKLQNPKSRPDKYAAMGATESILDAVGAICKRGMKIKNGVQAYRIKNELLAHGFKRTPQFHVVVSVTLGRLVASQRISVTTVNGERFYKVNEKI